MHKKEKKKRGDTFATVRRNGVFTFAPPKKTQNSHNFASHRIGVAILKPFCSHHRVGILFHGKPASRSSTADTSFSTTQPYRTTDTLLVHART